MYIYPSRYSARKYCPWASVIAKVEGGYRVFAYATDYATWRNQR